MNLHYLPSFSIPEETQKLIDFLNSADWEKVNRISNQVFETRKSEASKEDKEYVLSVLTAEWKVSEFYRDAWKEKEMRDRKNVVDFGFDNSKKEGTERIAIGGGYQLKAGKALHYNFVKNAEGRIDKKLIDAALNTIEGDSEEGKIIADRLVKWDPTLSVSEYRKLPVIYKSIIDTCLIKTDAAPTLEVVEPKGKK